MAVLREATAGDPAAEALVAQLVTELVARYGQEGASPAALADLDLVVVAEVDGVARACGGLRSLAGPLGAGPAEVKRMYVDPAARGTGLGRAVLRDLVARARDRGVPRLLLETGDRQPEAIGLYESEGWTPVEPFGPYAADPSARCYAIDLQRDLE